jgi:large subunit ribosomal protein L7/L12
MNVPVPVLIVIGLAFALLLFLLLRRKESGRDLTAPPPFASVPQPTYRPPRAPLGADLPADVEREVRQLAGEGRKIEAVKRVREVTGLSLADALEVVQRL